MLNRANIILVMIVKDLTRWVFEMLDTGMKSGRSFAITSHSQLVAVKLYERHRQTGIKTSTRELEISNYNQNEA